MNILSLTTYALALSGSNKSDLANKKLLRRQINDKGNLIKRAKSPGIGLASHWLKNVVEVLRIQSLLIL